MIIAIQCLHTGFRYFGGMYLENLKDTNAIFTYGRRRAWHQMRSACGGSREKYP